jgi:hypothetical protein
MDKKPAVNKFRLVALLILIGVIGFSIASFITRINIYVARGALGCAVIYLLSREVDFTMKDAPIDVLYYFPDNVKYLVWLFGLSVIFYWGISEILQLFFFVIRNLTSTGIGL